MNISKRSRTRDHVICYCDDCNGKYVDLRTKNKHSRRRNIVIDDTHNENDSIIESSSINESSNDEFSVNLQEITSSQSEILSLKMRNQN